MNNSSSQHCHCQLTRIKLETDKVVEDLISLFPLYKEPSGWHVIPQVTTRTYLDVNAQSETSRSLRCIDDVMKYRDAANIPTSFAETILSNNLPFTFHTSGNSGNSAKYYTRIPQLIRGSLNSQSCPSINQTVYENSGRCHDYVNTTLVSGNEHFRDSQSQTDLTTLVRCMNELEMCVWYYGNISQKVAAETLNNQPEGSFLVRNSSRSTTLFALSVKTSRGTTSIRIQYSDQRFSLDCDAKLKQNIPKFQTVLLLVDYYVRMCINDRLTHNVFKEVSGHKSLPVKIVRPKPTRVSSLKHLCRLNMNKLECCSNFEIIPTDMRDYLNQYPYVV